MIGDFIYDKIRYCGDEDNVMSYDYTLHLNLSS